MNLKRITFILGLCFLLCNNWLGAQSTEPSIFDYGRMWTFEDAPMEYFEETHNMDVTEEWVERNRKAALRFARWCSASFVSPDGLIMTNHHCARGVMGEVMKEGENFDETGFYAETLADERRVESLFVDQLAKIANVTDYIKSRVASAESDEQKAQLREQAFASVQEEYQKKPGWEDLTLQVVSYYSGGKYSLYGYKRYSDIRLVFIPELALGFFGGDPDNFTYPRYNLDCTFFRAYDDNGKPLNTSAFHYPVNPEGVKDGEPTFVIGNPGSTERYRTVAQLEYDRDSRFPLRIESMQAKYDAMAREYEKNPSHDLQESMFGIGNSLKAFNGILKGLNDPILYGRKVAMEQKVRSSQTASKTDDWDLLAKNYEPLKKGVTEIMMLNPFYYGEPTMATLQLVDQYETQLNEGAAEAELDETRNSIKESAANINTPSERAYLTDWLNIINKYSQAESGYMKKLLAGRTVERYVDQLMANSDFTNPEKLNKLLGKKKKKFLKSDDPLIKMKKAFLPEFDKSRELFTNSRASNQALEENIMNTVFNTLGDGLPPDATFTLRIADGIVKRYEYNGTIAPLYTTYFGLYDRHFSHQMEFPWDLPDRWKNPPMELLKAPLNFVSTNDIIGGNSGSAVINKHGESIGLVFDGNIESLPGNFIFDETVNRTVSVHIGGITAALQYIYKADRLVKEMIGHR